MPNNYDNRYDGREPLRPRRYDDYDTPQDDRAPSDRGYEPRRSYPDREPYPDRESYPPRDSFSDRPRMADRAPREEERSFDPSAQASGVTITEPKSYMEVQSLIDKLRRGESIIVNLEALESESAQRILDFLSGASYALGGSMCRVKEMHSTFLVTPHGTGITDTHDDRYPR